MKKNFYHNERIESNNWSEDLWAHIQVNQNKENNYFAFFTSES